jgi:hypothetical protein
LRFNRLTKTNKRGNYDSQAERLNVKPGEDNFLSIQIVSDSGRTNFMNITVSQLAAIIQILKGNLS